MRNFRWLLSRPGAARETIYTRDYLLIEILLFFSSPEFLSGIETIVSLQILYRWRIYYFTE